MSFLAPTLKEQLHSKCSSYLLPEAIDGDYFDYAFGQAKTHFEWPPHILLRSVRVSEAKEPTALGARYTFKTEPLEKYNFQKRKIWTKDHFFRVEYLVFRSMHRSPIYDLNVLQG